MNKGTFLDGIKSAVTKALGINFSEDATEADVLSALNDSKSITEISEDFNGQIKNLNDKLETLSTNFGELQKSFGEIKPGVTPEEMNQAIQSAVSGQITPLKAEFSDRLQTLSTLAEKKTAGNPENPTMESVTETPKPEVVQKEMKFRGVSRKVTPTN